MKQFYKLLFIILVFANPVSGYSQTKGTSPDPGETIAKTFIRSTCDSVYLWTENNVQYTESGVYTFNDTINDSTVVEKTLTLTMLQTTYGDTTAEACDSFDWYERTNLTQSGDYVRTFTNSAGCDSVVTLHLTIHHSTHNSDSVVACGNYEWHGMTYDSSGTYLYTYQDGDNCQNVDTLHLTILTPMNRDTAVTVCESYDWNGNTYTHSGIFTFSHFDDHGCWQVDTLHLTVNPITYGDTIVVSCDSFRWHDSTYFVTPLIAPTYTIENGNQYGCDSIVTLHLVVNKPVHTSITIEECESYSWHDSIYTVSSIVTYEHPDDNGCIQVDTLHLTIHHPAHMDTTVTECEQFTWPANGCTYTSSGDYTYAHIDTNGCTQVDTLHLTVITPVHTDTAVYVCDRYTWVDSQTYVTSGTYTYAHPDFYGCTQVDTLHLTIYPLPTPVIFGDNEICVGETSTLAAVGGNSYLWSTNETDSVIIVNVGGYYQVTVTNEYGCSATAEFAVDIMSSPLEKKNIVIKRHNNTPYMLIYPDPGLQYQWYKNNSLIEGENKQYYYPKGGLEDSACYKVAVYPANPDSCGIVTDSVCIVSSSAQLRILPNPNNGQFRLHLPDGAVSVQILNANGQVVMARKTDGDELLEMNTSLANGLYFVKTFLKDGSYNTEKLIINR